MPMQPRWHLGEKSFFSGLPREEEEFKSLAVRRQVRAKEFIFLEGEPTHLAYYLESGAVGIFRTHSWGKDCIVFTRRAGEMFGLAEVVGQGAKARECNAQALEPCVLYEIKKADLDFFLSRHYVFASRVMEVLGRRMRYLCEQIENLMVCDVTTRLLKIITYLSYSRLTDPEAGSEPITVPVRLTQEQMAAMIGSCQQTVSETLRRLEEEGVIRITRKGISVLNPAEMLSRVGS